MNIVEALDGDMLAEDPTVDLKSKTNDEANGSIPNRSNAMDNDYPKNGSHSTGNLCVRRLASYVLLPLEPVLAQ